MSLTLRDQDAQARRTAQEVFDRPVVLEAGAGTGKTATLVARVAAWALGPGWDRAVARQESPAKTDLDTVASSVMDRIVAITFTERAAADMEARIGEALSMLSRGQRPVGLDPAVVSLEAPELGPRCRALLAYMDRITVQTIHAFCRSILARYPVEAGLHPDFQVDADGRQLAEIVDEVMLEYLENDRGNETLQDLLIAGFQPSDVAAALRALTSVSADPECLSDDLVAPERAKEKAEEVRICAGNLSTVCGAALHAADSPGKIKGALETLSVTDALAVALQTPVDARGLCEAVKEIGVTRHVGRLKRWSVENFSDNEAECFFQIEADVAGAAGRLARLVAHLTRVEPETLLALCRTLRPLLLAVGERMNRRGMLTFSSLLRRSSALLQAQDDLAAAMRESIDLLLVDEFQDTDPVQCALVRCLALQGPVEQRPSLFLVGDPKQSIYGWRLADLRAYHQFVEEALAAGGRIEILTVNFRSVPAILDEVDRLIAPVMREEPGVSPPYQRLVPSEANAEKEGFAVGGFRPVEHWVSWRAEDGEFSSDTGADEGRQLEALAVAEDLVRLRTDHNVRWSSVAILMRTTSSIDIALQALREASIPYVVERDLSYFQRREVIDAASLMRAIIDPNDHVAALGFLRSPMVGVPDAALVPLWSAGLPGLLSSLPVTGDDWSADLESILENAESAMPALALEGLDGWVESTRYALHGLHALRLSFQDDAADVFVENLRDVMLQEPTEAARFLGAHRLANLERFHRLVLERLTENGGGPFQLLRELREGVVDRSEIDAGVPGDGGEDAVRILTIHKAKGLTYDHVYLMGLHGGGRGGRGTKSTQVALHNGRAEACVLGIPSFGFDAIEEQSLRTQSAELVRTLYVAATRPRHRLVLTGRWPADPPETSRSNPTSHMDLIAPRAHASSAFDQASTDSIDADGVRWRFIGGELEKARAEARARWDDTAAVAAASMDRDALSEKRQHAEHHMARPLIQAATSVAREHIASTSSTVSGSGVDAGRAMAVGTAIHKVLEQLAPDADLAAQLNEHISQLPTSLANSVPPADLDRAVEEATSVLRALPGSAILAKLSSVRIVARELPFLGGLPDGTPAESGIVSGAIDLVYADSESGEIVVADFKSDRVFSEEEIRERAAKYAAQGALYASAVQEGLGLEKTPPFEVWFLRPDRVVRLSA